MAAIIRFDLDVLEMTRQDGCCITVVVQNEIKIHQQKGSPALREQILGHITANSSGTGKYLPFKHMKKSKRCRRWRPGHHKESKRVGETK